VWFHGYKTLEGSPKPSPGGYTPIPSSGGYTVSKTGYGGAGTRQQEPTPKKKVLGANDKKSDVVKRREDAVFRSHRLISNELVNLKSFIG